MGIDLSGILGDRLEKALARAQQLEARGELKQAGSAFLQAAKIMAQYARSGASAEIRKKRLADAEQLKAHGELLLQGKPGRDRAGVAGDAEAQGESDSYRENARSLIRKAEVTWNDIAGLEELQRFVKESYGLALAKRPAGVGLPRTANLLLYGPPGTGKTLIAAAVSNGLDATFFSCKVSDMLSKYFGESGKLITAVFDAAEEMSPVVIFLDDFEALVPDRDGQSSGSERRVLAELLTCMDGFASKSSEALVLVIAATNEPWLIDTAILSRFGKLAYVPLPDAAARERMFQLQLVEKGYRIMGTLVEFAEKTKGYSGREIEQICKELVRAMISRANPDLSKLAEKGKEAVRNYELQVHDITVDDLDRAVQQYRPVTNKADLQNYEQWGD